MGDPDNPADADVEKLYGALSTLPLTEKSAVTVSELQDLGFRWDDEYLRACLERVVEVYEQAERTDEGYALTEPERDKHPDT